MANAASVYRDCSIQAGCAGDYKYPGSKMASVQFTFDAAYAQGGYAIEAILKAVLPSLKEIGSIMFSGPAFVDEVGGRALIPSFYPSAKKIMLYDITQATGVIDELADGALAKPVKLEAFIYYV